MNEMADRLVRLLGADPAVFRPVFRAQRTVLNRRAALAKRRAGWLSRRLSPFQVLCFLTFVSGVTISAIALTLAPILVGAAVVYTFGTFFLLLNVILDDFDVIVNPSEYLVLAAHPHDGWSVLLAKIVAVGSSIAVLGAFYFVPGAIITLLSLHSVLAAVAFLIGGASVTVAVGSGGMLFAAAMVSIWGRAALDRILPMVQIFYMISIIVPTVGRNALRQITLPPLAKLGIAPWIAPPAWFIWPLEIATGSVSSATWLRAALASGSLIALVAIGSRWIGGRFGERLLDPPAYRRRRTRSRSLQRGSRIHLLGRTPETRALLALISTHLRSDFQFRTQFIATTITPLIILTSLFVSRNVRGIGGKPEFVLGMLGFGLTAVLGSFHRVMGQSSRPEALWFILAAPIKRTRFSLATIPSLRGIVVIPHLLFMLAVAILTRAGGPVQIAATIVGMGILAEALLRFWRGFYQGMPFSQPIRSAGKMGGGQILAMFGGTLIGAGFVATLMVGHHLGLPYQGAVILVFVVALIFAAMWARRRVSREAEAMELGGDVQAAVR
ncbi:MAG TPA: hypothetical protein VET83_08450 [Candidatus Dormibacteraeota bacterium]|nr:hypothetical protein [Candidatus Dormibacteraeota bacterium]